MTPDEFKALGVGQPFNPNGLFDGYWCPKCLMRYVATGNISRGAKDCLIILNRFQGNNEMAWPGQEKLSEEMGGVNLRNIGRYVTELEADGFIQIEQRGLGQTNIYRMLKHRVYVEEFITKSGTPKSADPDQTKLSDQRKSRPPDRIGLSDQDQNRLSDPLHLSYEVKHMNVGQSETEKVLAANAAVPEAPSKVQTNPSIDGIGKIVRLVSDENLSDEVELSGKESSAPSKFRTKGSVFWTSLDEKIFWSRYKALPKAKSPRQAVKTKTIYSLVNKIKASPEDALLALGPFADANRGTLELTEFVKYFATYLAEAQDQSQNTPPGPDTETPVPAIRRARTNQLAQKHLTPQGANLLTQPGALTALGAITRWNTLVKSNPVEYDPRLNGAECRKLSELCRDKDFAEAFDGVCGMCEKICAATAPGDWMPDLWWLTGSKNDTANWYKVFKGKFDWKSKPSLGGRRASIFDKLKDF